METYHDIVINVDILVGIPAKTQEDALDTIDSLTTEELLTIALKQLPFAELENGKPITIN